jgi:fructosamine-3-kinase
MALSMFLAEQRSLNVLRKYADSCGFIVPKPYFVYDFERGRKYTINEFVSTAEHSGEAMLVMEYVEMKATHTEQEEHEFARALARLHQHALSPNKQFGFEFDNFIGKTLQKNPWTEDWISFFRDPGSATRISIGFAPANALVAKFRASFGERKCRSVADTSIL